MGTRSWDNSRLGLPEPLSVSQTCVRISNAQAESLERDKIIRQGNRVQEG